ncbi:TetR/AcrR family transcriptional regulator [Myceligenerans indicum]|uniref:Helix-turn-helix transcriptional regulator n=1 Tax=Myceligenerans indicum TaxID=2593663 RepID=A0ABS1LQK1_9MICO|nr:TetR/AcrR family transcriptional regulator [Myceligenerans indicum]MBL0888313.1 helix-turn-helix transcriptional regulator [Myceligenerans indicum]
MRRVRRVSLRADARLNRDRIVAAARAELASARTPSMVDVARAAGVGQGTLYRHFPTWQDLLLEVHLSDMDELAAAAPRLLEEHPPLEALRRWLQQLAEYGRLKRSLSDAMHHLIRDRSAAEGQFPNLGPFDLLIDACKADGSIRQDVTGYDLMLLVGFLWRLDLTDTRDERSSRLLDVVLDGLKAPDESNRCSPMPSSP